MHCRYDICTGVTGASHGKGQGQGQRKTGQAPTDLDTVRGPEFMAQEFVHKSMCFIHGKRWKAYFDLGELPLAGLEVASSGGGASSARALHITQACGHEVQNKQGSILHCLRH